MAILLRKEVDGCKLFGLVDWIEQIHLIVFTEIHTQGLHT
jgi:hypothetical protein